MPKRPHGQDIERAGIVFFQRLVDCERAVQVFGIKPTANSQDCGLHVLQMRHDAALLPKRIVVRMFHSFFPEEIIRIQFVAVLERPQIHVVLVAVARAGFGKHPALPPIVGGGLGRRHAKHRKREEIFLHERPVVVEIIEEEIGNRGLRRGRFQGRMPAQCPGNGIKPGIRNAPLSYAAIVERHVPDQPIHRVVRVRSLVNGLVFLRVFLGNVRGHVRPRAFAHVTPPHILIHHNVFLAHHCFGRRNAGGVLVGSVRVNAVAGALHQHRVLGCRGGIARHIHNGKQFGAVAHGYPVFVFAVVFADKTGVGLCVAFCGAGEQQADESEGFFHGAFGVGLPR